MTFSAYELRRHLVGFTGTRAGMTPDQRGTVAFQMTLTQAVPPAYTEWIGTRLLAELEVAA